MRIITCKHCGGEIQIGDEKCAHCGIPLPPDFGRSPQKRFTIFFIGIVIFCIAMILWLPPDWTRFIK
jgi:predicted nucleic acid-binding Zn ribbon protein